MLAKKMKLASQCPENTFRSLMKSATRFWRDLKPDNKGKCRYNAELNQKCISLAYERTKDSHNTIVLLPILAFYCTCRPTSCSNERSLLSTSRRLKLGGKPGLQLLNDTLTLRMEGLKKEDLATRVVDDNGAVQLQATPFLINSVGIWDSQLHRRFNGNSKVRKDKKADGDKRTKGKCAGTKAAIKVFQLKALTRLLQKHKEKQEKKLPTAESCFGNSLNKYACNCEVHVENCNKFPQYVEYTERETFKRKLIENIRLDAQCQPGPANPFVKGTKRRSKGWQLLALQRLLVPQQLRRRKRRRK